LENPHESTVSAVCRPAGHKVVNIIEGDIYIYIFSKNLHCNLYVKHKCCNALPKLKKYSVLSIVYKKP
jgi:hypothetical protein